MCVTILYFSIIRGVKSPWSWPNKKLNSWRIDLDLEPTKFDSMLRLIDAATGLSKYAGFHAGWNDLDILAVGTPGEWNYNRTHEW